MPSSKLQSSKIHKIRRDDLLRLLNKPPVIILRDLNHTEFGFIEFLKQRRYKKMEGIALEPIVKILNFALNVKGERNRACVIKCLHSLKECSLFLFEDIPSVVQSWFTEKFNVDIGNFVLHYLEILIVMMRYEVFSQKIVDDIFPKLQNFMNELRNCRVKNFQDANNVFVKLGRFIDHFVSPDSAENQDDDLDIESFRSLSIVPRSDDIINTEVQNVPYNIVDKPYRNIEHYLSVHFRLMREDMLRSFRDCVKEHTTFNAKPSKSRYYEKVTPISTPKYTTDGIFYDLKVSTNQPVNWSEKKILIPGTLLCLTPNRFRSVVFVSVFRSPKADFSTAKEFELRVKLEDDTFDDELEADTPYEMLEPDAYFECYKHVLAGIKGFTERTFPLSDIIVKLDFEDAEPEYLKPDCEDIEPEYLKPDCEDTESELDCEDTESELDCEDTKPEYLNELQLEGMRYCLHEKCSDSATFDPDLNLEEHPCKVFYPLKYPEWPDHDAVSESLQLDSVQYEAYRTALTRKVALIQGPPGTGKTHVGCRIVKALLENDSPKPILISCMTNHALDQFLERVLKYTKKVVRVGGGSASEIIKNYSLNSLSSSLKKYMQDKSRSGMNKQMQKCLNIVESFSSMILEEEIVDTYDESYVNLQILCNKINLCLCNLQKCEKEYLEENALVLYIPSVYQDQLRERAGSLMKSLSASLMEWLVCSRKNDLYEKCEKKFARIRQQESKYIDEVKDVWNLTESARFQLFYYWLENYILDERTGLQENIEIFKMQMRNYKLSEAYDRNEKRQIEILKYAQVIGATTTGACKYKKLIQFVHPKILIIEEAAQVLESHVIASLVPSIEHLILIGDHEQLRPLPSNHELSEKYGLKISMFERLFLQNAPRESLVSQHRMKPCIAELLVPKPYIRLESARSVYEYEEIRGVQSSVFFFDHQNPETDRSFGTSASNEFEANMIVSLAKYFILMSYLPENITILTTYAAQVNIIQEKLNMDNLEVHATTVDNYQGEENDIILISFVRNNPNTIGYMKERNRINVALSRAKKGMFCLGNFQRYADKDEFWSSIVAKLRLKNMIGDSLMLQCLKHKSLFPVLSSEDITKFMGFGCSEKCNFVLPCNHLCTRTCHFDDPDHILYDCKQPCERTADNGKLCPRLCYERCKRMKKKYELPCGHFTYRENRVCREEITKRLPCGHLVTVPCHLYKEPFKCEYSDTIVLGCGHKKSVLCHERKNHTIEYICTDFKPVRAVCGHLVDALCNMEFDEDTLQSFCKKECGKLLECGHACVGSCYLCFSTGIHEACHAKCEMQLPCGHICSGLCNSVCPPCCEKCFLTCPHNTMCINDCLRPCVDCFKPCERQCKHIQCANRCSEKCIVPACSRPCKELLPCGHRCIGLCGDPCPWICRVCQSECLENDTPSSLYVELECEHIISVSALDEHIANQLIGREWPSCPQCSEVIKRSTRYKVKLMDAKEKYIQTCDTSDARQDIQYHLDTLYGFDNIVPSECIKIDETIKTLLGKPMKSNQLYVLRKCLNFLGKLIPFCSTTSQDAIIHEKFSYLLKWILCHLTFASFQQLREFDLALNKLLPALLNCTETR